jgi:hypothetical protein
VSGESLHREVIAELRRAIGFDRWCWPPADPDTLIPGSGFADHDWRPSICPVERKASRAVEKK